MLKLVDKVLDFFNGVVVIVMDDGKRHEIKVQILFWGLMVLLIIVLVWLYA